MDPETLSHLRSESAKRRVQKKKENKSIKESFEIQEWREERLEKKREYMKKLRSERDRDQRQADREKTNTSKQKSRLKQNKIDLQKKNNLPLPT